MWPLDLNRRLQLPSVASRLSPREVQFQKQASLDLYPAHSNWCTTALNYPHTACGRPGKNYGLETDWYNLCENKLSGWQRAYLQTNHKSLHLNILSNSLQHIKIIRWAEQQLQGLCWGIPDYLMEHGCRGSRWSTAPSAFQLRLIQDLFMTSETSVLHKQNDTRRENSKAKYFWVITEPVLPNCRQVLRFVCLFVCVTTSKRSHLPQEGFPTTPYLL